MLFALELSNRYKEKGLSAFSLHPGGIRTNLIRYVDVDTETETIVGADGKPLVIEDFKWKTFPRDAQVNNAAAKPYALDDTNARKLWALSEKLVGQKFD
ncbi:hypothetical protein K7432_013938 [Basidiobolus ranarum]|uniref:Uncharacterized protein n=1 Tax=Basidiobolus ranarum TaxID=34480 RepID=A0ABR2WIK3_9FUNG